MKQLMSLASTFQNFNNLICIFTMGSTIRQAKDYQNRESGNDLVSHGIILTKFHAKYRPDDLASFPV